MNITIIGASSGIGLITVRQALAKGHQVTTLSRNLATIPDHPSLKKISGTATSVEDVKIVIAIADAVIVTIGKSKDKAPTLFPDTAKALITAFNELRLNVPLIVITGFGAGDSLQYNNSLLIRIVIGMILKKEYRYKTEMEKMLSESNLKWEVVRPGMLTNGAFTGNYKVIPELYKGMKVNKISREDVSAFLLSEAENPTRLYKYVTITS